MKAQRLSSSWSEQPLLAASWIVQAVCQGCGESSYWYKTEEEERLLYPRKATNVPLPHAHMPASIKALYQEAALILPDSPRASAALSRLAIDLLTRELEPSEKTFPDRMIKLVQAGLPQQVQTGLEALAFNGSKALHPAEIDLSDNSETGLLLLRFLNLLVDYQIAQPQELEELYQSLPPEIAPTPEEDSLP